MSRDDPLDDPQPTHRGTAADDPVVILRLLQSRGQRFDNLPPDKALRRLRLCVKLGFLSEKQQALVEQHLYPATL